MAVTNTLVDPTNTNDDVHGMDIAHSVLSGILYLQATFAVCPSKVRFFDPSRIKLDLSQPDACTG